VNVEYLDKPRRTDLHMPWKTPLTFGTSEPHNDAGSSSLDACDFPVHAIGPRRLLQAHTACSFPNHPSHPITARLPLP
jgi:hypothetical protein